MKNIFYLILTVLLFSSSSPDAASTRIFEVGAESRIDGCVRRHNIMVDARNVFDAREKAQKIARYKLTTKAINAREIKKK